MAKQCEYIVSSSGYQTSCGSHLIHRPSVRCDKCGRKPVERKRDAASVDRAGDRPTG